MLAGLGTGVAGPSRDLLIKRATPAGATGRVYGTVYRGSDAGLAVSAPIFGWLMDHDLPRSIFFGAATAMLVAMLIGLASGKSPANAAAASASLVSRATEDEHRGERRYVHAFTFGNFLIGTGVMLAPGLLMVLSGDLGTSVPQTALLITVAAVAMCIGSPVLRP